MFGQASLAGLETSAKHVEVVLGVSDVPLTRGELETLMGDEMDTLHGAVRTVSADRRSELVGDGLVDIKTGLADLLIAGLLERKELQD